MKPRTCCLVLEQHRRPSWFSLDISRISLYRPLQQVNFSLTAHKSSSASFHVTPAMHAYKEFYADKTGQLVYDHLTETAVNFTALSSVRMPSECFPIHNRRKFTVNDPRNFKILVNPLNPELNPICYLLALLAHHFLHVSRIRVKLLTFRLLMS